MGEEYYCLTCGDKMIAKNKKKEDRKRGIHFAHFGACAGSLETYLHKAAKIILSNEMKIVLPRLGKFQIEEAVVEKFFNGIIPDILITDKKQRQAIVEIFVAHKTEPNKIAKIKMSNVAAFEINLSRLNKDSDYKTIRYEVIDNLHNRIDLNPPKVRDENDERYWWIKWLFIAGIITFIFWPRKKPFKRTSQNTN